MRLNEWLCDGSKKIAKSLEAVNQTDKNTAINYTTRTQIIDILNNLRFLILPELFERTCPVVLQDVLEKKVKHVAIDLCDVIRHVIGSDDDPHKAESITINILEGLAGIRKILDTDIQAAYKGDPAAKSIEEIILSYPSVEAISIFRIAHLIHSHNVPTIPRIMTEYAHKNTGIDIHPGATIGESFFIDHGTGAVIGETCTIGHGVKLYQGVTLGAKSFALDENGNPIKGIKRHPDIGDNVVIYAGATILGGDTTIGAHSVIGGNVWLTHSVPPHSTVFNTQPSPIIKKQTSVH